MIDETIRYFFFLRCCWQGNMQINAHYGHFICAVCCCDVMLCDARLRGFMSFQFQYLFLLLF